MTNEEMSLNSCNLSFHRHTNEFSRLFERSCLRLCASSHPPLWKTLQTGVRCWCQRSEPARVIDPPHACLDCERMPDHAEGTRTTTGRASIPHAGKSVGTFIAAGSENKGALVVFTDTLFGARSGLACTAGKFTVSTTTFAYAAASLVAGHDLEGRGQYDLSSVTGVAVVGFYSSSSDQTSTWKASSPSESSRCTS